MGKRIFVGLSGGVDSAVSAALLKRQGHDVVGAFIKIWSPEFLECTWKEDRIDAMRVCAALNIPFKEVDLSRQYKHDVVDSMLKDYAEGCTPNPDVLCNRSVKFGAFLAWAREQGADLIATGHYAQIAQAGGHLALLRGVDTEKDQSYFLYQLGQQELSHAVFPVGGMTKQAVRALAAELELPVAAKPDSQGLCFVGDVSMPDFLRRFIPVERGIVLDMRGKAIGEHEGAALYTLGERHGFSLEGEGARTPHYIIAIDVAHNAITVSPRREDAQAQRVRISEPHWIWRVPEEEHLQAQSRHRGARIDAALTHGPSGVWVTFAEPQLCAPGQSLVLYRPAARGQTDECLGGGAVVEMLRATPAPVHSAGGGARARVQ